jgi:hypothetical protein
MARLKTREQLEQERLETLQRLTGNYPLPTTRPALVYSRYSTAKQVRDSIAAGLQQSEKMIQRALDLEWTRELLILFIENQMTRDGRIRSVSGTIPIEDREGISTVIEHVKGKMLRNRKRKAEQGKVANGRAPVGLMLDESHDNLLPSPHAEKVDWLYGRFRALDANLAALYREVFSMAARGEPIFPDSDVIALLWNGYCTGVKRPRENANTGNVNKRHIWLWVRLSR